MMQAASQPYLQTIAMSALSNWSVRYLLENKFTYNKRFPLVAIGDFLVQDRKVVNIEDDIEYMRVTVSANNRGVSLRDREMGKNIGTKRQFRVRAGQFIISKIDARNGAFGLVPEALEGAIVTNDFPVFNVDETRIRVEFLVLITTTQQFIRFAQSCSSGTTNRQRVDIDMLLAQRVPLPSLVEQNRIVEEYEQRIMEARKLEKGNQISDVEIKEYLEIELGVPKQALTVVSNSLQFVSFSALHRWDGRGGSEFKSDYPILRFEELISEISTGTTPSTSIKEYWDNGDVNFYSPSDIGQHMYLSSAERQVTQLAVSRGKARSFNKGTLLFVGIGSTVGKIGILQEETATSNQQITGIRIDENRAIIEYVFYYFHYFKHITTKEKTQSTIPIVNQDKIRNIPIPVPSMDKQRSIAERVTKHRQLSADMAQKSVALQQKAIVDFEREIFA